jgi:WD40 repeat protein
LSKLRCQTFDVNRDGTFVAIAEQSKQVTVWQLDKMKLVAALPHAAECGAVAFAPDDTVLATTSRDGKTRIWNWKDKKLVHEIGGATYGNSQFRPLAFAPSGGFVVAGDGEGTIRSIDVRAGTVIWSQPAHKESVSTLAVAADGHTVASASGYSSNDIKLWDDHGKPLGTLSGHTAWVSGLTFSPDGKFLVSCGSDQTLRIWDYANRRELAVLRTPTAVLCVAVSPDSKFIVSGGGSREISVWDMELKRYQDPPLSVAGRTEMTVYSPDGRSLYLVHNGAIEAYDPLTLQPMGDFRELAVKNRSIAVSADGRQLAAGSEDGRIRVWDCATEKIATEISASESLIYKVAFMADGATLVSVSPKGDGYLVQHWSVSDSHRIASWVAPRSEPYFGSELWPWVVLPGLNLYVTRKNGELSFWDLTSGKLRHCLNTGHTTVDGVALSPDGKLLATGGWEGVIKIWDPQTGRELRRLKEHLDGVHGLTFSHDGTRLVSGSNGREAAKVWDTSTWRVLATLPGRGSQFKSLVFSPDGRSLAAIPNDRLLHLWPAPGLAEIDSDSIAEQQSRR